MNSRINHVELNLHFLFKRRTYGKLNIHHILIIVKELVFRIFFREINAYILVIRIVDVAGIDFYRQHRRKIMDQRSGTHKLYISGRNLYRTRNLVTFLEFDILQIHIQSHQLFLDPVKPAKNGIG